MNVTPSGGSSPLLDIQPAAPSAEKAVPSAAPLVGSGEIEHIHQGEGSPWIAQGLGYDQAGGANGAFFTTYYRAADGQDEAPDVRLSVQDGGTGEEIRDVYLAGPDGKQELSKGGGVAVAGEYVYVADTSQVYVYRRDDIYNARPGDTVQAVRVNEVEGGSASYINIHEGKAYVGRWVENHPWKPAGDGDPEAHVYQIDPATGRFIEPDGGYRYNLDDLRRTSADPLATIQTPYNVQGIAVTEEGVLFSASFGDFGPAPSDLVWQGWSDASDYALSDDRHEYDVPDYNEGVQIVGDQVYVASEEGADKYDGEGGVNEVRRYDLDDIQDS